MGVKLKFLIPRKNIGSDITRISGPKTEEEEEGRTLSQ
jgi:hypothetical protein